MGSRRRTILAVDDDPAIPLLISRILEADYDVIPATSATEALQICQTSPPDMMLLDLRMPTLDGFEVCRRLRQQIRDRRLAIIIVSGYCSREEQAEAFAAGADDYISKPINPLELESRVRLHFRLLDAIDKVDQSRRQILTDQIESRRILEQHLQELAATRDVTVLTLARIAEARDPFTGKHLERISAYSHILAKELHNRGPYTNEINDQFIADLRQASILHDIGKVAVADTILLKPGRLTPDEWERMKQHSRVGSRMLTEAVRRGEGGQFLAMAVIVARSHHERFDGRGYPDGLAGDAIPLSARIVAVADVFDALTSMRPYKPAWPSADARDVIEMESGGQFDPAVVEAFLARFHDFVEIQAEQTDTLRGFAITTMPDCRELVGTATVIDAMR